MRRPAAMVAALLIVAGAFVAGRHTGSPALPAEQARARRILYYVDPMHPAYRSDKPGIAADCGMALEPVYEAEDVAATFQLPAGAVWVSPEKQRLIGLRVERLEKNSGVRLIRTTGRVQADDNRIYRITAGSEGWVQSLHDNPSGTIVKKNELLATFYSREFRNLQQAYLGSLASLERLHKNPDDPSGIGDANLRANEEQLRTLGLSEAQISELAKTHQIARDINICAPVDGIVLVRHISPEQRFDTGMELYEIADLSRVWILADLYSEQASGVRPGTRVKVAVREAGKTLNATVSDNPPLFDPVSRTLELRLEAENPGWILRPDMFVDLEFSVPGPAGLSIPQEAVLDDGMRKLVYVESSDDVFAPRAVEVGAAYGDRVAISSGLSEGDRVLTSGTFLIDGESRMRSPAQASLAIKETQTPPLTP